MNWRKSAVDDAVSAMLSMAEGVAERMIDERESQPRSVTEIA
jgi:hypothetical protein